MLINENSTPWLDVRLQRISVVVIKLVMKRKTPKIQSSILSWTTINIMYSIRNHIKILITTGMNRYDRVTIQLPSQYQWILIPIVRRYFLLYTFSNGDEIIFMCKNEYMAIILVKAIQR